MNLPTLNTSAPILPVDKAPSRRPLLTPLLEPGHFLLVLDNTATEKFTTCPLLAYYYLVLGREPHARNAALVFGGAIHAGLEKLLTGSDSLTQDKAITQFFMDNPPPMDDYRTLANALAVMEGYRQREKLPDYEWEIQKDGEDLLVEKAFEVPLGVIEVNDRIPVMSTSMFGGLIPDWIDETEGGVAVSHIHIAWSGRIDAVALCNSRVRIVDHKTTSRADDDTIQEYHIANQTLGYVYAARQLWPSLDVSGACLNFIHFKKPTGSGPIDLPGPRGGPPALAFFRSFFDYSPDRMSWWHNNIMTVMEDFVHCLVRGHFPAHTKSCMGRYGRCSYHAVCSTDSEAVRDAMIKSEMFKPVTWNPVR